VLGDDWKTGWLKASGFFVWMPAGNRQMEDNRHMRLFRALGAIGAAITAKYGKRTTEFMAGERVRVRHICDHACE
jgi:hypothetical protein